MKIVCQSCGAKYSVPDEKVAGKVFKIRCKKCSEVIVVRGDQPDQGADAAAAPPAQSEAVWHVIVNGEQQGPMLASQIGELLSAGTVDWEAYAWREGFDGWVPLRDIEPLVAEITGQAPAGDAGQDAYGQDAYAQSQGGGLGADPFGAPPEEATTAASEAVMQAASRASLPSEPPTRAMAAGGGGGLFAEPAPFASEPQGAAAAQVVASRASSPRGADLFADTSANAFNSSSGGAEDEDVVASAPGPRVTAQQAMTGARNENSVLFSLANLQALATGPGGSSSAPAASPAASGGGKAGHAAGDGSGLIDIRALASAQAATGPSAGGAGKGSVDDLLSIGTGAAPFAPTLGAPVLLPAKKESNNTMLFAILGAAALVAVAIIVGIVVFMNRTPSGGPVAAAPTTAPATGAVVPTAPSPSPTAAVTPVAVPSPAATPAVAASPGEQEPSGSPDEPQRRGSSSRRERHETASNTATAQAPSNPAPERNERANTNNANRSIDDLLNNALTGSRTQARREEPEAAPRPQLPPQPNRDQVLAALRSVQADVRACGQGQHGTATTAITVASNGRVTAVNVTGQFQGTPIGSCVARAVRGARFPQFSQPTFSVNFPYAL